MNKFEQIFNKINEDFPATPTTPVVGAATTTTPTASATNTQKPVVPNQPPVKIDANHPLIQQLAKTNNPADVAKLFQSMNIAIPQK